MTAEPTDLALGFLLNTTGRLLHDHASGVFAKHGLDPVHAGVLWNIQLMPGRTQKDYAAFQRRDATTFGRMVDRLEALGLLQRTPFPGDRRGWCLTLTSKGTSAVDTIRTETRGLEEAATAGLSTDEISVLARALMTMLENLSAGK